MKFISKRSLDLNSLTNNSAAIQSINVSPLTTDKLEEMNERTEATPQSTYNAFPYSLASVEEDEKNAIEAEKRNLMEYLSLRFLGVPLGHDDDDMDDDDDERRNSSHDTKEIPSIQEAHETATSISRINLDCSKVTLDMVNFTRLWKLRPCKSKRTMSGPRTDKEHIHSMPTTYEDNGPLALIYRCVLSVEVSETSENDADDNSILIFFYDEYAKAMSRLLSATSTDWNSSSDEYHILLCLHDVPAECILFHRSANVALGDCKYCICIGGDSKVQISRRIRDNDGREGVSSRRKQRFDTSVNLEVLFVQKIYRRQKGENGRVLAVPSMKCYKLNATTVQSSTTLGAGEVEVPPLPLAPPYRRLRGEGVEAQVDMESQRADTLAERYVAIIDRALEARRVTHDSSASAGGMQQLQGQEEQGYQAESGSRPFATGGQNTTARGGNTSTAALTNADPGRASSCPSANHRQENSSNANGIGTDGATSRAREGRLQQQQQRNGEAGNAAIETAATATVIAGRGHADYSYVPLVSHFVSQWLFLVFRSFVYCVF